MNRFFILNPQINDNHIFIPADISHQIRNVLRMKSGDRIAVFDNGKHEWLVELSINAEKISGVVINNNFPSSEPTFDLTLFFSLTQRSKVELILQKCTEIGVSNFQPFISKRSLIRALDDAEHKRERWEKIIIEAAEQSNRGKIPGLLPALLFEQAIRKSVQFKLPLIAWENENQTHIRDIADGSEIDSVGLIIGPEGGIEEEEMKQAANNKWIPVSLGKRILRMETAAIVGTALILDRFEQH